MLMKTLHGIKKNFATPLAREGEADISRELRPDRQRHPHSLTKGLPTNAMRILNKSRPPSLAPTRPRQRRWSRPGLPKGENASRAPSL